MKGDSALARFDGRIGIITGAASSIGKETAICFAAEGGTPVTARSAWSFVSAWRLRRVSARMARNGADRR